MPTKEGQIEVAKISSRQAIIVAAITAIAGLGTGYLTAAKGEGQSAAQIKVLENERAQSAAQIRAVEIERAQARNDLTNLKQRVRDILGPKRDAITRMSRSLERMKVDPGISKNDRERLDEIVEQLNIIDNKVLVIVEK